ncbi:unnamed protein product [Ilex paraguariensis]|uniref:Uncharacterized protein n=1 Tax=Ilex paraguariensis TaxID=185542 RepID=A0ABC8RHH5_9AQUA
MSGPIEVSFVEVCSASGKAIQKVNAQTVEVAEVVVLDSDKAVEKEAEQWYPSLESIFWVDHQFVNKGRCEFSLDDDKGLIARKIPVDKGYHSDNESLISSEKIVADMEDSKLKSSPNIPLIAVISPPSVTRTPSRGNFVPHPND